MVPLIGRLFAPHLRTTGDQQPLSPAAAEEDPNKTAVAPKLPNMRNDEQDVQVYRAVATLIAVALAVAVGLRALLPQVDSIISSRKQQCNVLAYGAVGHGGAADDTEALQTALDNLLCTEVVLPSGHVFSATELWVRRDGVTLTIEPNATLAGLPTAFRTRRPDCTAEPGLEFRWESWCALLHVTATSSFTLRGGGDVAPGGVGGRSPDFYSAIHVRSTSGVRMSGVRVVCTAWWWCCVLHNASDVSMAGIFIDGSAGRDGIDLVNCRRVLIEDSTIEGSDDALCFKSIKNGGLGAWPSAHVMVRNVTVGSVWCNAIQFGSATEVDMHNFTFRDVRVARFARKAAVSMVSMDGAVISDVRFERLSLHRARDVAAPIFLKVGNRAGCEDGKGTCQRPGSIANIGFEHVSFIGWGNAHHPKPGHAKAYTATIEGLNASHRIGPVSFRNVTLVAPGGGTAGQARVDPPFSPLQYQPRFDGVRPAFGLFVRYARDISLVDASIGIATGDRDVSDERPAIVADEVERLTLTRVRVTDGLARCQLQWRNSSGDWADGGQLPACPWNPQPQLRRHA